MHRNHGRYVAERPGAPLGEPNRKAALSGVRSRSRRWLIGSTVVILIGVQAGRATADQARPAASSVASSGRPCLDASRILEVTRLLSSATGPTDSYKPVVELAFGSEARGVGALSAFEENRLFVCAAGPASRNLLRRLVILKPSIFVVDIKRLAVHQGSIPRVSSPRASRSRPADSLARRNRRVTFSGRR